MDNLEFVYWTRYYSILAQRRELEMLRQQG